MAVKLQNSKALGIQSHGQLIKSSQVCNLGQGGASHVSPYTQSSIKNDHHDLVGYDSLPKVPSTARLNYLDTCAAAAAQAPKGLRAGYNGSLTGTMTGDTARALYILYKNCCQEREQGLPNAAWCTQTCPGWSPSRGWRGRLLLPQRAPAAPRSAAGR